MPEAGNPVLWLVVAGPRGAWAAFGPSRAELGLPGVPWPSAHCPTLSELQLSEHHWGRDCQTQAVPARQTSGLIRVVGQFSHLPWRVSRREQIGIGKQALNQKRKQLLLGTSHSSSEWLGMLVALCDTLNPEVH